ncbi:MAG: DNA-3-methyladenine glycosylase 2 family protein, partial [Oscillospiraceae bacterium]|nr:DNA-3-methyladenine glycosylase 2 family protein [Oscillospiraceae bacterium]
YAEAKRRLMELPGIGEKVANCVVLFSLRMPSAFPIDVWIKKAIAEHYPNGLDTSVFGENAGLAQQYMFYYQRDRK